MKNFNSLRYSILILLLLVTQAAADELPAWWDQLASEAKEGSYSLVDLATLKNMYDSKEKFLIVDVRTDYEYEEGHLPGAVNFEFDPGDKLQLKQLKRDTFLKLLGPDKQRKIVFYCRSFR